MSAANVAMKNDRFKEKAAIVAQGGGKRKCKRERERERERMRD